MRVGAAGADRAGDPPSEVPLPSEGHMGDSGSKGLWREAAAFHSDPMWQQAEQHLVSCPFSPTFSPPGERRDYPVSGTFRKGRPREGNKRLSASVHSEGSMFACPSRRLGHACSTPPPSVCGWEKLSRLWGSPLEHCEHHWGPEFQACSHSGFRERQ